MDESKGRYRGRFAPSPTGPLHFGSLVAAVASWLDARAAGGEWLVRVEDLDQPRCVPGAEDSILRTLEVCGLDWDGEVARQRDRCEHYAQALEMLKRSGDAFACGCTRREIADSRTGERAAGEVPYPGTCRNGLRLGRAVRAWRLKVNEGVVRFRDRLQGEQAQDVLGEVGDFVLQRADGIWAYQLAVVVDDTAQGITDVVRGADLLSSTPRQIALQRALELETPRYLHVPAAANARGEKLSKQTLAPEAGVRDLPAVLRFLGLTPPPDAQGRELLVWAVGQWDVSSLPARQSTPLPGELSTAGSGGSRRG